MKVSELTGTDLDAAVAKAEGRLVEADEPGWKPGDYKKLRAEYGGRHVVRWYSASDPTELGGWEPLDSQGSPSTDWEVGGPIIERDGIELHCLDRNGRRMQLWMARHPEKPLPLVFGETALIAAMRAKVASKFGQEVPDL